MGQKKSKLQELEDAKEENARLINAKVEDLNDLIREMRKDPTLETIMKIFDLLKENPNWDALSESMAQLTNVMKEMATVLNEIENEVSDDRVDKIHAITENFKELLRATSTTIQNVTVQASIQQNNIESLIKKLNTFVKSGVESKEDESKTNEYESVTFNKNRIKEELYVLTQWISHEAVKDILKQWEEFYTTCHVYLFCKSFFFVYFDLFAFLTWFLCFSVFLFFCLCLLY